MVAVVRQVTALFANELIMDYAECDVRLLVVAAHLVRFVLRGLAAGVDLWSVVAAFLHLRWVLDFGADFLIAGRLSLEGLVEAVEGAELVV